MSQPLRHFDERKEQFFLLFGARHQVEEAIHRIVVAPLTSESNVGLCFGRIGLHDTLGDIDSVFLEQAHNHGGDILEAGEAFHLVDLNLWARRDILEHDFLAVGETGVLGFEIIGRCRNHRFALHLQPRRNGSLIHIADRAEIVIGNPLP